MFLIKKITSAIERFYLFTFYDIRKNNEHCRTRNKNFNGTVVGNTMGSILARNAKGVIKKNKKKLKGKGKGIFGSLNVI